jgi:hypothetical protein
MLGDFSKIPAGSLKAKGAYYRFLILGRKTGTAGTALLAIRVGGSIACNVVIPANQTSFKFEGWVVSQGDNVQRVFATVSGLTTEAVTSGNRSYNTDADLGVHIRGTLGNSADTLIIDAAYAYTTDIVPMSN